MADCVCMLAYQVRKNREPNQDNLIIDVHLSTAAISHDPLKPARKLEKTHWSTMKTLEYPRQAILEQCDTIILNMIQGLEFPVALTNDIHWGLDFPDNDKTLLNLEEIIARLVKTAHNCAKNKERGDMEIRIRKLEKVCLEDYHKLRADHIEANKPPLDDWIMENMNRCDYRYYQEVIFNLFKESPKENKYFGLKSVKIKEEESSNNNCSICMLQFKKGEQAIQMPCSHIFHGFCVLEWIKVKPTCPLCRFDIRVKETKWE